MKFFAPKRLRAILTLAAVAVACSGAAAAEKVLLDTDMVEAFDDGIAMLMLARAPQVELLGVTTVVGNTWVEEGTAYALRQLEAVKLEWKVPVAMGFAEATRRGRAEGLGEERRLFGEGHDDWMGAYSHPRPESWQAAYKAMYGVEPKCAPVKEHAVDLSDQSWVKDTDYAISIDGKTYGYPVSIEARGLIYNADAIKKITGKEFKPEDYKS